MGSESSSELPSIEIPNQSNDSGTLARRRPPVIRAHDSFIPSFEKGPESREKASQAQAVTPADGENSPEVETPKVGILRSFINKLQGK